MISIISIDIGLKTFSIYKEYFDVDKAKTIKKPSSTYHKNGEATDEFEDYVLKISTCGQCEFIEKTDFGERKDIFSGKAFLNAYEYLDNLHYNKHLFEDVDIIIMEKQLGRNPMATTLMNHVYSWFLIQFRDFKKIILYPSKNKTRILGAPLSSTDEDGKRLKMDKSFRKKWSTEKAHQILIARNDEKTYNYIFIQNKSKKDDLSDVITQCLSFHIKKLI
jgi:hypothetical protein